MWIDVASLLEKFFTYVLLVKFCNHLLYFESLVHANVSAAPEKPFQWLRRLEDCIPDGGDTIGGRPDPWTPGTYIYIHTRTRPGLEILGVSMR